MAMILRSAAFGEGSAIPEEYTCDGSDRSPPLTWSSVPEKTRSFALVCTDPDAPHGTFHHWAVFDIPASAKELAAGSGDADARGMLQARNDFGKRGYGGPCPPRGHDRHRYRFQLLALSAVTLALPDGCDCRAVASAARDHILAEAVLTGTYTRK
jgi:Raf kinase inhibitor-like YbhB/YbcL family protein